MFKYTLLWCHIKRFFKILLVKFLFKYTLLWRHIKLVFLILLGQISVKYSLYYDMYDVSFSSFGQTLPKNWQKYDTAVTSPLSLSPLF